MAIALLQRERVEEAVELMLDAIMLAVEHETSAEDIMRMTIDDVAKLSVIPQPTQIPDVPPVWGWDKVWYGRAAFKEDEE